MVVLDFFIVNVAMPGDADRAAREHRRDRVGRRRLRPHVRHAADHRRPARRPARPPADVLPPGCALFTVASAACGLSPTARDADRRPRRPGRRRGAALHATCCRSSASRTPGADRAARALASTALVLGLAAVGGQLIGGALVDGRRLAQHLPDQRADRRRRARARPAARARVARGARRDRLDLAGTALITLALVDIVLPLVEGRQHGWPLWTWLCLGAAPVAAGRVRAPPARPARPRRRAAAATRRCSATARFSAGLLTQLAFWSGQASFFLVFALYLQQGRGLGALQAGLVFTILAVAYLAASVKATELTTGSAAALPALGALIAGGRPRDRSRDDRRDRRRTARSPCSSRPCC